MNALPFILALADEPKTWPREVDGWLSMPPQASTFAAETDWLYGFITVLNVIFFAVIIGAMTYFVWKYRRKSADQKTSSISHNGKIEFAWSVFPTILLLVIFYKAEKDFMAQTVVPENPLNVHVVGKKWFWSVRYPDYPGGELVSSTEEPVPTLLVPKGRPVKLTLTSDDVIHSFYVPAFRIKRDAVPGKYNTMWFTATEVGRYNLFCTEYCGTSHSKMAGTVLVLEPDEFEARLKKLLELKPNDGEAMADFGQRVYNARACVSCHSLDGSPKTGPSWKGLFGKTENLADGSTLVVDENYIRQSILEPNAQIVSGFAGGMPSYAGQLDDEQITALIEFIKTVK